MRKQPESLWFIFWLFIGSMTYMGVLIYALEH